MHRQNGVYALWQLGSSEPAILKFASLCRDGDTAGWLMDELFGVVIRRTQYLNSIIPCEESQSAVSLLREGLSQLPQYPARGVLHDLDSGHIYVMIDPEGNPLCDPIRFVKRSGGAIQYDAEWAGLQTQEVLRVMIDRLMLNRAHWGAADLCRKALWEYEARAYRRKRQEHNRQSPEHSMTEFPYGWEDIETHQIGNDGHIPYLESEIIYYGYFGGDDPIPGADPFTVETDPVYRRAEEKLRR